MRIEGRHVVIVALLTTMSALCIGSPAPCAPPALARGAHAQGGGHPNGRPDVAHHPHEATAVQTAAPVGYDIPIGVGHGMELQGKPGVAYDGTNFLVVWGDLDTYNIYGARVSPNGDVLDSEPIAISVGLNDLARQPSVAFDGETYFVSWCATRSGDDELYGARVTPGGEVLDPDGIRLTTGGNALNRMPGIAFDGTNYLIAWRTPSTRVRAARVTPQGVNLDAPAGFLISGRVSKYPAVAFDGTNYMVVWYKDGGPTNYDIYGARIKTDGTILDPGGFVICDAPMSQTYPTIAYNGEDYLVAWYDYRPDNKSGLGSAYGARVSTAGNVLDVPSFKIAERTLGGIPVQVTFDGSDWLVVYAEAKAGAQAGPDFRKSDVYGFQVASDGEILNQKGIPIATSFGDGAGPTVGCGGGRCLAAWGDYFRRGVSSDN